MKEKTCESCLMPLSKDTGVGGSDKYCSFCFMDGKLVYEGNDVNEFKKRAHEGMIKKGMNPILAKFYTWMIGFAPRWNNKHE